jgi:hypothetical protein
MNPLDQPTPYAGAPEWPKPFAGTPTGIIGETYSQPLHDLVHRTPTLAPTPRTDEAYFAPGATMYSLAGEMKLIERDLTAAKAECAEKQATFDLMFSANLRGIKMWQDAHPGHSETWPDLAKLVAWLLSELTRLRDEVERWKGALALGQQNCDDAYDDLREERDEAIARAEKAEAERAALAKDKARLDWMLENVGKHYSPMCHDRAAIDAFL